jgi:hypothetical protein
MKLAVMLLSLMLCIGCGGGQTSSTTPPPPSTGLAGSWTFSITDTNQQTSTLKLNLVSIPVSQNGCQISTTNTNLSTLASPSASCFGAANDGTQSIGSLTSTGAPFLYPYQAILVVANPSSAPTNPAPIEVMFYEQTQNGSAEQRAFWGGSDFGSSGMLNGTPTSGTSITGGVGYWLCGPITATCTDGGGTNGTFSGNHN